MAQMVEMCRNPRCISCPRAHQTRIEAGGIQMREIKVGEIFYTLNLRDEIACTFYSAKLNKVSMVRNPSCNTLELLFRMMNMRDIREPSLIDVCLVGGDGSEKSEQYAKELVQTLNTIDNGTGTINLALYEVGHKDHPESFQIDCHGKLSGW